MVEADQVHICDAITNKVAKIHILLLDIDAQCSSPIVCKLCKSSNLTLRKKKMKLRDKKAPRNVYQYRKEKGE
jgi:hypothetical protein